MDFTQEEIKRHIDEYARLTVLADDIAKKIEDEKVYFTALAERDLSDSKAKTKRYYGSSARITASTASTVKIDKDTALRRLFGGAYDDYVKTEVKTDIKDAETKRMLAAIFCGDYISETPESCIRQMTADTKQRSLLAKKIKGANPLTDAKHIEKITNCSEEDAIYYASIFAEVKAYEAFIKMMKLAELTDEEAARELIHLGFTVDKTAKVGIELIPEE